MKNSFLKLLSVIILMPGILVAQGIAFEHEPSWKEILSKAKESNKLIFVDAYTTWCGPCKKMANEVFIDKEVGDLFNTSFVNVKIDMEKGEGPELAKSYGVSAYPTYLFVNGDGEILHTGVGFMPARDFIELAETALNPELQYKTLKKRWLNGERSPEFLYNFTDLVAQNEANNSDLVYQVANDYLDTQKDWLTPENADYLLNYAYNPKVKGFAFILTHIDEIDAVLGKGRTEAAIEGFLMNDVYNHFSFSDLENLPLEKISNYVHQIYPAHIAGKQMLSLKIYVLAELEDWSNYPHYAITYVDQFGSNDAVILNEQAWIFYEHLEDKKMLEKAIEWALKSVQLDNDYYNNDTVSALYYKTGNLKEAKMYAEKAIALAKESKEDYSSTQALLDKIKL